MAEDSSFFFTPSRSSGFDGDSHAKIPQRKPLLLLCEDDHFAREAIRIRNRLCKETLSALFGRETVMSKEPPRRRRPKGNRGLPRKYRVLFLAAEPAEGGSIGVDKEMREVQQHTRHARRPVIVIPRLALRLRDLNQAIFDAHAQIIHFSGHGSSTGDLYFEDDMKRAQLFETAKFVRKQQGPGALLQEIAKAMLRWPSYTLIE